jgi:hypothetical protein
MTTSNSAVTAIHNIVCRKGDSFLRQFVFWEDEAKTNPLDISSLVFKSEVVRANDKSKKLITFIDGNGFSKSGNTLTMSKTATEMLDVDAGLFQYDIQQTNGSTVTTIISGSFKIEDDITA